jgi:hypothetical protein
VGRILISAHWKPPVIFAGMLVLACAAHLSAQIDPQLARAVPLNRFHVSRYTDTDANGYYSMPMALGEDYFDGNDSLVRVARHLRTARRAGVKYLRCAFSWNGIERKPGEYSWTFWDKLVSVAAQSDVELIPYVAYTPRWAAREAHDFWKQPPHDPELYADFMYRIAARYRARIHSWELWNEPDNKDYWTGTAGEYANLVARAAMRVREAGAAAVLVLGGMANGPSEFLHRLMTDYSIHRYVDVIALHAYPESWGNERAEIPFQKWIPAVRQMIAQDHSGADLWINEMGYADYRFSARKASLYGTELSISMNILRNTRPACF